MNGIKGKIRISRDAYDKVVLLAAVTAASAAAGEAGGGPLVQDGVGLGAIAVVLVASAVAHVEMDRRKARKAGQSAAGEEDEEGSREQP